MKKSILFALAILTFAALTSCEKGHGTSDIDTEKPQINADIADASPTNGSVFYFGDMLAVKMLLTDNGELGSFSIEIHNNFDGHSHSTEDVEEEEHEHHHEEGEDGDAFYFSQDYIVPFVNSREYLVDLKIPLPTASSDGDLYAGGKYHFMLTVTDQAGFSVFKAYEIEILQKEE